jgi:hypothetical protein
VLVPKTAVNENHFVAGRKDKIGFTGQVFAVKPEAVPGAMKHPAQ